MKDRTPPPHPPARSDGLRVQSRYRLLAALRAGGPVDRGGLGVATGLSGAAVSRLTGELIAEGLVAGTRLSSAGPGRPTTRLELDPGAACTVTVSVGIDRIDACAVDFAGHVRARASARPRTRGLDAARLLRELVALIERVRPGSPGPVAGPARPDAVSAGPLRHIAVAVQGVTEHATSTLLWSPVLPARDVPLAAELRAAFGVPASLENDCRAISRALHADARDRLGDSFATVLFSDGVGLGLHLGGRAFAGARSSALEFGHLRHRPDGARCRCGRRGCIEAYAADYAIARSAAGRSPHAAPGGRVAARRLRGIADAALAGDALAAGAFESAGRALGEGLGALFTLLDPMPVALVGRDARSLAPMRTALLEALADVPGSRALGGAAAGEPTPVALHRFDDPDALLGRGLRLASLDTLDRTFAAASPAHAGTVASRAPAANDTAAFAADIAGSPRPASVPRRTP